MRGWEKEERKVPDGGAGRGTRLQRREIRKIYVFRYLLMSWIGPG